MKTVGELSREANIYYVENYGGNLKEGSIEKEQFIDGYVVGYQAAKREDAK